MFLIQLTKFQIKKTPVFGQNTESRLLSGYHFIRYDPESSLLSGYHFIIYDPESRLLSG